jgi:hypothetical protein
VKVALLTVPVAFLLTVSDERGSHLATLLSCASWYVWDDGVRLAIDEQAAWCVNCTRFVLAEDFVTEEREQQRIAEAFWQRYPDERTVFLEEALLRRQRVRIAERKRWTDYMTLRRVSPPRCLRCGSTEIAPLRQREWIDHPAQFGRVRIDCTSAVDASACSLYSPEGLVRT